MNINQKCNCCIKESVCVIRIDYCEDCERIKNAIRSKATEVSIKCKEFYPNQSQLRGETK